MSAALAVVERDAFASAEGCYAAMVKFLKSGRALELSHSQLERDLEQQGRELMRQLLQAHLDLRGPGATAGEVVGADQVRREDVRQHERGVQTIFGEVRLSRLGYGGTGLESLHPLDAELDLPPELYSLEVRQRAAEATARQSFDETVASLERQIGNTVGKRQTQELVQRAAQDFDSFYATRSPGAQTQSGSILVLSADGKGVVMLPRDLRADTRKAAQNTPRKLATRLTKGEQRHRKRMATVAAVYTLEPQPRSPEDIVRTLAPQRERDPTPRPRPESKRVWASLEQTPERVIDEAFREALRRDPEREKTWVALVDGNQTQLTLLRQLARKHGVRLTIVLDIIHVAEYLWDAALVFHSEASAEREARVTQRLLAILQGRASWVAAAMRRSATLRGLPHPQRSPVDDCARYLLNHKAYLHYDRYLAAGFPIATGVIEGACRHLVCDRMDVGALWSLKGAEAVLRLRALRSSGDWDDYWTYHEQQQYQRTHVAAYADGRVPQVQGHGRRILRLVK